MVIGILVGVLLTVVVFRPLQQNWGVFWRIGIWQRQLTSSLLRASGICGGVMVLETAESWRRYAALHDTDAVNRLMRSPFAISGAALTILWLAQAVFLPILRPADVRRRIENARAKERARKADVRGPSNDDTIRMVPPPLPRWISERLNKGRGTYGAGKVVVKGERTSYVCLHEAGQALLHFLRGDTLVSVSSREDYQLDAEFSQPVEVGGAIRWRSPERKCACGGYTTPLEPEECIARYGDADAFACRIQLGPRCADCAHYAVTYLAALYAGRAATEFLMPNYPDPGICAMDDLAVDRWFEDIPVLSPIKAKLIGRAQKLSLEIVRRESKALQMLMVVLAFTDGSVDGTEAERIIKESLVSRELAG